ncbi:M99 family carboxypeptidase catalytic domain-containing protein, partial [Helicobacter suis]
MKVIFSLLLICVASLKAASIHVFKKQGDNSAPTLLLMGGIQGDEPGGFNTTN